MTQHKASAHEVALSGTRVVDDPKNPRLFRRKTHLEVVAGPDTGKTITTEGAVTSTGSAAGNDLQLSDPAVSRYHLQIAVSSHGFLITDLDSTNGTFIGPLRIREVATAHTTELRVGSSLLRFTPLEDEVEVPLHVADRFGKLLGRSPAMRALFAQLPRISAADATVLIEGETGTGKEWLAEEIHRASPRHEGPFIVVDCGAVPENLLESELFGHVRGAFTGADARREGAFEAADGGTIFLDEIGEMNLAAQPKLLRVIESRTIKPVGAAQYRPVDVRIVAATNRDLRRAINEGVFRSDLYYRLSVVRLDLPPLRERPEDIELLARHFLDAARARLPDGHRIPSFGPATLQRLVAHRWPGNIRELRNFVDRAVVLAQGGEEALPEVAPKLEADPPVTGGEGSQPQAIEEGSDIPEASPSPAMKVPFRLPYKDAKSRWIDHFERHYVEALLSRNQDNVAAAARDAGVDRTYLFRLIRRYGLRS